MQYIHTYRPEALGINPVVGVGNLISFQIHRQWCLHVLKGRLCVGRCGCGGLYFDHELVQVVYLL